MFLDLSDIPKISNTCPQRCIQGWKSIPQTEAIFQMNIAGWIVLGLDIPEIQEFFINNVNEVSRIGILHLLGFDMNARTVRVEETSEEDIDPIELEPFHSGEEIYILGCSHKIKTESLLRFVQNQARRSLRGRSDILCPMCRQVIGVYSL
jgi:hypothetical protein